MLAKLVALAMLVVAAKLFITTFIFLISIAVFWVLIWMCVLKDVPIIRDFVAAMTTKGQNNDEGQTSHVDNFEFEKSLKRRNSSIYHISAAESDLLRDKFARYSQLNEQCNKTTLYANT
jgi:hypothetical protein